jgi:hypothetical protein
MKIILPDRLKVLYTDPMVLMGRRGLVRDIIGVAVIVMMTAFFVFAPVLANAQIVTTIDIGASTTATTVSTSTTATSTTTSVATTTTATSTTFVATTTPPVINSNVGVEAQVHIYFANTPVMIAIASCESSFREFNSLGMPLNGGSGGMIGIFQISTAIHGPIALSMGMDINTVAGNMAYANYLYQQNGTTPWLSSFPCWNPIVNPTVTTQNGPSTALLHSNLVLGTVSPEVVTLQQLLNKSSTPVATSGPGSPGQETIIFGTLTKIAVRAFQCAHDITCSGDEYSTGYGAVGPATRIALLSLLTITTINPVATVPVPMNTSPLPGGTSSSIATTASVESPEITALRAQIVQLEQILALLIKARNA